MIVCYDDFNQFTKVQTEIDEDQHFLFNHIRKQFAEERNITVEFVYVKELMEFLPQLRRDNINTFVFEFTFNDRSDDSKLNDSIDFFSQIQVNVPSHSIHPLFSFYCQYRGNSPPTSGWLGEMLAD